MMELDKHLINRCTEVIVQIATPYSIGTGFYIQSFDLIVTNEHIVRGNKKVVISGSRKVIVQKEFVVQLVKL